MGGDSVYCQATHSLYPLSVLYIMISYEVHVTLKETLKEMQEKASLLVVSLSEN